MASHKDVDGLGLRASMILQTVLPTIGYAGYNIDLSARIVIIGQADWFPLTGRCGAT